MNIFSKGENVHRFKYLDVDGEIKNYYPDFYLPQVDLYLETKGFITPHEAAKILSTMNKVNLLVIDYGVLSQLKRIFKMEVTTNYYN